jgi:competence protein ComEC
VGERFRSVKQEGDGVAGARTWILDQLDAERSRWMLWLPVAMGLGIAVCFELPSEPALWLGPALAADV